MVGLSGAGTARSGHVAGWSAGGDSDDVIRLPPWDEAVGHDADVGLAAAQRVERGVAGQLLHIKVDVGMVGQEVAQGGWQGL